ncbi:phage tail protein, partial [Enterobacter hormaechei subsp. steigerwaltii]|nr:phage tail protein [Enterobacter hormaechei subsp. steigerwaltii]
NEEAEGIKISRLDVGVYVLTGSAGLASEGWQLLPPMDPGGMGELGVVEAEQTESGGLTIRLYKRKYILSDEGEIIKTKGELMDVPANSWIDVRLDMPESSAWNQRQKDAAEPAS